MWAAGIHDAGPASAYSCLTAVATHVVVSCGQSTNQTTWVASDVTVVTDTELKLVFQCYLHVLDGTVASCLWQAVYLKPFRRHQKTVLEIIIAVLHCFEWKACWPMCICDFMQLLLWIQSVPVSNAHVRFAFVCYIVRPHVIAWVRNVASVGVRSPLLVLFNYLFLFRNTRLSMYWGSRHERH